MCVCVCVSRLDWMAGADWRRGRTTPILYFLLNCSRAACKLLAYARVHALHARAIVHVSARCSCGCVCVCVTSTCFVRAMCCHAQLTDNQIISKVYYGNYAADVSGARRRRRRRFKVALSPPSVYRHKQGLTHTYTHSPRRAKCQQQQFRMLMYV